MPFEHRIRKRVEFAETDMAGIVHFSRFFNYMESAEQEFLRSLGFSVVMSIGEKRYAWPRVNVGCDYRRPLRFEEEFDVVLLVREVRARSIVYDFIFALPTGEFLARGAMTAVCVSHDGHAMSAVAVPAEVLAKIQPAPPHRLAELLPTPHPR
jgi:acyl-CoA thioester hydrolase